MNSSLPVARPPWTKLGQKLESACRKALYDFEMIQDAGGVSVALSGGKDSLSLLFLLHAIRGKGFHPFQLFAIHVQGEFSCGAGIEGADLRAICQELDIPLIVRPMVRKLQGLDCYSCSRERRKILFAAAKEIGAPRIAFGHHQDDSAQTLLMNVLHKAELAAILPKITMHRYGVTIIRPLIYIKEDSIRSFAKQYGFLRLSCQCPVGQNSRRKKIDRALKDLEEFFPHAKANLARVGLKEGSNKASKIESETERDAL